MGKEYQFPIDISCEPTRGSFAFQFEQHLQTGKIFNITHDFTVRYYMYMMMKPASQTESGKQEPAPIYPVDNMYLSLKNMSGSILFDYATIPTTPEVLSTSPEEAEIGFDIDGVILINFTVSMDEQSVLNATDIVPAINAKKYFNAAGTQLIIDPQGSLPNNTYYTILINNNAKSASGVTLTDDFTLHFQTEV